MKKPALRHPHRPAPDHGRGTRGVGYVSNLTPWSIKAQRDAIEAFAEQVVGEDPMTVESINAKLLHLYAHPALRPRQQRRRRRRHRALGPQGAGAGPAPLPPARRHGQPVPVYASWNLWWQYDLDTLVTHAREHIDRGFRQMKYRMGGVQDVAGGRAHPRPARGRRRRRRPHGRHQLVVVRQPGDRDRPRAAALQFVLD